MKMHWKILLGVLTAIVPSFFTYLAARAESDEAKIRAEMAYVAMQANVKELQGESYKHAIELAEIRGQLRVARKEHVEIAKSVPGVHPLLPKSKFSSGEDNSGDLVSDVPVQLLPPPDFNKALGAYKAKKK
jgi:hypothetical protein